MPDSEDWLDDEDDGGSTESGEVQVGLWLAGRRKLTPVELKVLRRTCGWLRVTVVALVMAMPVLLFAALLAATTIEENQGLARWIAITVTALFFIGIVVLFFCIEGVRESRRDLQHAASRGSVDRFTVITAVADRQRDLLTQAMLARAMQTGMLCPDSPAEQSFEVLAGSIWRVNDERPRHWRRKFPSGQ